MPPDKHKFHHRHFPTFIHWGRSSWSWYRSLRLIEHVAVSMLGFLVLGYVAYHFMLSPLPEFPTGAYITIADGNSLSDVASLLKDRGAVRSARTFREVARLLGDDRRIPAGVYYFPTPQNLIEIAIRVTTGDFETTPIRVTVPEGATVEQISRILLQKLPTFDRRAFLSAAEGKEGYLFPDTYFFMPGDSTGTILSVFNNNFNSHLLKAQKQIAAFKKPLPEVLTMASLLEKEASDTRSRRIIAGILWHRIQIGMPLQVDAVFPYIIGKNSFQLTLDDLKTDSPYNTYTNKGLPPSPISNPSLDSITAAVTPIKTDYLFYLSDKQGNFHFAATYQQFLVYKHRYLGS